MRARSCDVAAPPVPPVTDPQERLVARLVSSGMSNREVAAELLVSAKTIEVHLTRIYAKLGVGSRGQLTNRIHEDERARRPATS